MGGQPRDDAGVRPGAADDGARAAGVTQPALPLLRTLFRVDGGGAFAHPAERDLAGILSFYHIRWSYEPTTFVLARAADGRPAEMFTPDFYLPELRLYIELTTMRQRLVTRKNRKLRRLRELYPNVRIKLLYRRDYLRLLDCYRLPHRAVAPCRPGRVLYPAAAIQARIADLAARIARDDADPAGGAGPLLVLGVGRGSEAFLGDLTAQLAARRLTFETDRVELTRFRRAGGQRGVRVRRGPGADLAGRRVLIVEDVVSTGLSLRYLVGWLRRQRVAAIEVCALLDRRVARLVEVPIRYAGFEAPNELLVGFGLHLRRQFRDLPFIATVEVGM